MKSDSEFSPYGAPLLSAGFTPAGRANPTLLPGTLRPDEQGFVSRPFLTSPLGTLTGGPPRQTPSK